MFSKDVFANLSGHVVAGFPVSILATLVSHDVFLVFTFLTYFYAWRVNLFLRAGLFANLSINSVKTVTCLLQ